MAHSKGHVCQCLGRLRHLRRNSPLTITGDRCRTGVEFVDSVLNLAHGLLQHDIGPGDVIAIAALNSDLYLEWLLAITYIGGIVAPLNYRWSFEEARSAMDVVRPVMLVVDESCSSWAPALQNNRERCNVPLPRLYVLAGESSCLSNLRASENMMTMDSITRTSHGADVVDLKWAPRGVALICFTSGTTGRPKGVAISHEALIAQSLTKIAVVGYGEDDVYLHTAPLCHIGGISSCMSVLMAGGCHVFIPKFDANIAFQAITQHRVTSFITVPAIMADLISVGRKQNNTNIGRVVEKILNGGGGLSDALIDCATHTFPHAKIISAYGMTETTSSLTFKVICDPTMRSSRMIHLNNCKPKPNLVQQQNRGVCVGKPAPHVELCIYGNCENSRSPLIGSILTRGMHVMVGYWDYTNASYLDSSDHGWLDTGDVGWLDDDGDLWLIGRNKDRIKSGGENIYPEEVENVLSQHPGVLNAFVVGIPDVRLAEKVVAYVTTRNDWKWIDHRTCHSPQTNELSDEILRSYCRQRNLSGFKIPKMFILWSKPWPLTTTGKVKREDLRTEAISYLKLLHSKL